MDARTIIDELERKYGSSRDTARAIGVHFPVYLMWIADPDSMTAQVRTMLQFRAGLTPGAVTRRARFGSAEDCDQVVNG
jgi:hypothetical protein